MSQDIHTLLQRGVDTILPTADQLKQALEQAQKQGKKLRVYLGIDPTSPHLHIGHTVALRKLAHFQQAGHQAILLIGDFTARLGDPDKLAIREPLTKEKVQQNMATYLEQVSTILDFDGPNPIEVRYNSEWSDPLTYEEIIKLASNFTVSQMLERDMFQRRLQEQRPISLSEFFYPLMQGYDAVMLEADVQIGGTDQTFNMLAGRTLNKALRDKEMLVLTVPLLADSKGVKVGKTQGNAINIDNPPNQLYGQIMSLSDDVIVPGLTLLTDIPTEVVEGVRQNIEQGQNPMPYKKQLAELIVAQYHGQSAAEAAARHFSQTVQANELPTDIPEYTVNTEQANILDVVVAANLADSKSKARTLLQQGALELNGQRLDQQQVTLATGDIIKAGKRNYVKIVVA